MSSSSNAMAARTGLEASVSDVFGMRDSDLSANGSARGTRLNVLKTDNRAIFTAASHAQRAADYLHSLQRADG